MSQALCPILKLTLPILKHSLSPSLPHENQSIHKVVLCTYAIYINHEFMECVSAPTAVDLLGRERTWKKVTKRTIWQSEATAMFMAVSAYAKIEMEP